ncbi:MAG: histidine kinase, partial [Clostridium sp.]|nr:histidine kinase [Clostridium sp.]
LSLSKGQDVVSLHDELEHVKTYIQIQNYRFDNRISLDIQVPDSLLCVPVIKLVLQPLVENSILHGRVGSADISGQILIKGTTGGNDMILTVEDNGIGMDEALLDGLLDSRTDHNGYGLYNIDQRFKLYYGEHYGLSFQSSPNRGMSVSIRFPGTSLQ